MRVRDCGSLAMRKEFLEMQLRPLAFPLLAFYLLETCTGLGAGLKPYRAGEAMVSFIGRMAGVPGRADSGKRTSLDEPLDACVESRCREIAHTGHLVAHDLP